MASSSDNLNGMRAQNWKTLPVHHIDAAASQPSELSPSQLKLFSAIVNVTKALAQDMRGTVADDKYRYIVDLIVKRISAVIASSSSDELAEVKSAIEDAFKDASSFNEKALEAAISKLKDSDAKALSASVTSALSSALLDSGWKDELASKLAKAAELASAEASEEQQKKLLSSIEELLGKQDRESAPASSKQLKDISKQLDTLSAEAKKLSGLPSIAARIASKISSISKRMSQVQPASSVIVKKSALAAAKSSILDGSPRKLSINAASNVHSSIENELKTISKRIKVLDEKGNTMYQTNSMLLAKLYVAAQKIAHPMQLIKSAVAAVGAKLAALAKAFGAFATKMASALGKGLISGLLLALVTPGGMYALGFVLGYIWKRFLEEPWKKVSKFIEEFPVDAFNATVQFARDVNQKGFYNAIADAITHNLQKDKEAEEQVQTLKSSEEVVKQAAKAAEEVDQQIASIQDPVARKKAEEERFETMQKVKELYDKLDEQEKEAREEYEKLSSSIFATSESLEAANNKLNDAVRSKAKLLEEHKVSRTQLRDIPMRGVDKDGKTYLQRNAEKIAFGKVSSGEALDDKAYRALEQQYKRRLDENLKSAQKKYDAIYESERLLIATGGKASTRLEEASKELGKAMAELKKFNDDWSLKKQYELGEQAAAAIEQRLAGIEDKEAKRKATEDRLELLQKVKRIWKMLDDSEKYARKVGHQQNESDAKHGKAALLRRHGFSIADMADSAWNDESDGAHDSEDRSTEQKLANALVQSDISINGDVSSSTLRMWKKAFGLEYSPDAEIKQLILSSLFQKQKAQYNSVHQPAPKLALSNELDQRAAAQQQALSAQSNSADETKKSVDELKESQKEGNTKLDALIGAMNAVTSKIDSIQPSQQISTTVIAPPQKQNAASIENGSSRKLL